MITHLKTLMENYFKLEIVEMVRFQLGKELRKMFFRLVTSVGQRKKILSPHVSSSFLILYRAKNLPSLLFLSKNNYAIDIVDPSSMQDACHMNFVIDLAHRGVSVAQWQSIGAQIRRPEVRFLMGTQNFSLSHARDKTKKHLTYFKLLLCYPQPAIYLQQIKHLSDRNVYNTLIVVADQQK